MGIRAQVGWISLHRISRRRIASSFNPKPDKPLTRYFPEIVEAMRKVKAKQFVLDGEMIVPREGKLSFDDLLQRIHPAASRIAKLAAETPAQFVAFDLLMDDKGKSLVKEDLSVRRPALEKFHRQFLAADEHVLLSRSTGDLGVARSWLDKLRGQLDGVIAKRLDQPYLSGERAMLKIKNMRTADCVVGGFRYGTGSKNVGSLFLGLYNKGLLDHVGFTSSIAASSRAALTKKLEKLIQPPGFTGGAPGGPSRWSTDRSTEWEPLEAGAGRRGAIRSLHRRKIPARHEVLCAGVRTKIPKQCTMKQVEYDSAVPLKLLTVSAKNGS